MALRFPEQHQAVLLPPSVEDLVSRYAPVSAYASSVANLEFA